VLTFALAVAQSATTRRPVAVVGAVGKLRQGHRLLWGLWSHAASVIFSNRNHAISTSFSIHHFLGKKDHIQFYEALLVDHLFQHQREQLVDHRRERARASRSSRTSPGFSSIRSSFGNQKDFISFLLKV